MSALAWIAVVVGVWAAVAPFVFPWDVCLWVYLAGIIPGALAAVLSGWFASRPGKSLSWLCWISVALGVWLIVSPFVAGYHIVLDVAWSNFVPGVVIVILSAVAGLLALRAE
jgi:hypothetical protein